MFEKQTKKPTLNYMLITILMFDKCIHMYRITISAEAAFKLLINAIIILADTYTSEK